jgi:hypothetical protein
MRQGTWQAGKLILVACSSGKGKKKCVLNGQIRSEKRSLGGIKKSPTGEIHDQIYTHTHTHRHTHTHTYSTPPSPPPPKHEEINYAFLPDIIRHPPGGVCVCVCGYHAPRAGFF